MAANFYGSPLHEETEVIDITDDFTLESVRSEQHDLEGPICFCKGTCSKRSGKRPGCPCKDENLKCSEQCMCGKKCRGTVVKWCSNGKEEIFSIEQELELARLSVQNIINDLTLETLKQLTIEFTVSGEGSLEMFRKLCLDRDVLQLNIAARCDIRADPMDFSMDSFRKAAYRQFTLWKYGRLGRDNRRILPSCVVKIIREAYPSPDGQYMGFKNN
eukprot:gene15960-7292_t